MPVGIRGDFGKLERWADLADKAPEVLPVISKNLAEETVSLVRSGMKKGQDPYGTKYKSLALRDGQPLRDSGQMMAAWHRVRADARGFKVGNAKKYATYHQHGTGVYGSKKKRIKPKSAKALRVKSKGGPKFFASVKGTPRRMMVPDRRGLPRHWRQAYVEVSNEVLLSHFRSRRSF